LSEDERIDDIQFYTDPDAELIIDDIVLYDAAPPGEKRLFPARLHFTGWFDTGKQGKEWPGDFEGVAKKKPHTWRAAKSVPHKDGGSWLRVHLRGERPLGEKTRLRFLYHLTGMNDVRIALRGKEGVSDGFLVKGLRNGEWAEIDIEVDPGQVLRRGV